MGLRLRFECLGDCGGGRDRGEHPEGVGAGQKHVKAGIKSCPGPRVMTMRENAYVRNTSCKPIRVIMAYMPLGSAAICSWVLIGEPTIGNVEPVEAASAQCLDSRLTPSTRFKALVPASSSSMISKAAT